MTKSADIFNQQISIEYVDAALLIPAEYNPRQANKNQHEQLKESIKRFGLKDPIIVNSAESRKNIVIGGHFRLRVAQDLGIVKVPVVYVEIDDIEKEKELNVRLNKNVGEFDFDLLANFEKDMLLDIGFDSREIDRIFHLDTKDENEVPSPAVTTETKRGDIFTLGEHRLMCGDSTDEGDVNKLLKGSRPVLMVTDPPYGVNYDPSWREGVDLGVGDRSKGKVANDDVIDWSKVFELFDTNVLYVWHAGKFTDIVAQGIRRAGYDIISQIIWGKQHFVISRGDYHWQHEPCWYAVKSNIEHNWQGLRNQTTLWTIENNNSFGKKNEKEETYGHGTQKPVECMLRPILNNSSLGNIIVDPFLGSGTTLIACEKSDRICYGMEIDPIYCDVIVKRWEEFTGQKAVKNAEQ